jgi:hypothetical protein
VTSPSHDRAIRVVFSAFRSVDLLFQRTLQLVDVPRVGERVQIWFPEVGTVRGAVRDVQWTVPEDGSVTCNVQIELATSDRRRFARRSPMTE